MIYRLNSIYSATEGEGIHIGSPQTFIRFQGCRVGCYNCDSKDTWSFRGGKMYTTEMVLEELALQGFSPRKRRISITGGDPLDPEHREGLIELISVLKEKGAWVNIEAAGNIIDHEVFDLVDFISFDLKTPSTKVVTSISDMIEVIKKYYFKLQIKSVIFDQLDFDYVNAAKESVYSSLPEHEFPWVLTPVFNYGEDFPKERVHDIALWNEARGSHFRVISQQHKWVHGPNKKFI
jgi:7-carboxy-7-deazaguanine synthase